jgi:hypothetical protein
VSPDRSHEQSRGLPFEGREQGRSEDADRPLPWVREDAPGEVGRKEDRIVPIRNHGYAPFVKWDMRRQPKRLVLPVEDIDLSLCRCACPEGVQ